jgi:selenocysteine-specific elongation factor
MAQKKDVILELARAKGSKGLTSKEIQNKTGLPLDVILERCQSLEGEGRVRILVFTPLLVMEKSALDDTEDAFFSLIQHQQERNPQSGGITKENIFLISSLPNRVTEWVLQRMVRTGKLREERGFLFAVRMEPALTSREKWLLSELENMYDRGEFLRLSLGEIQRNLEVSTESLDRLLEVLLKSKKVLTSRDGILFHSQWLDKIITAWKESGKKTFTVAEFKEATGLTRKFAIPLLEFLDQTGATRKEGSKRILL